MTTDDTYFERGINLRHGYLAEYYADSAEFLVKLPKELRSVGVLMEPTSVAEKAIGQAFEIQRRLRVWQPKRALVLGTGTLGLLASMILRLRGLEVVAMGRTARPYLNADLLDEIGARYLSTADVSLTEASEQHGKLLLRRLKNPHYRPVVFDFVEKAREADVALFFFAGHGLQISGRSFLMPTDARLENEAGALRELMAIQDVVSKVENAAKVSYRQPGDPMKLAAAIVRLAASPKPPVHLPLGNDTLKHYREKSEAFEKEVAEWHDVITSTDYDDVAA